MTRDEDITHLLAENKRLKAELTRLKRDGCYPAPSVAWSASMTCSRCGQSWVMQSNSANTTAHVCPALIDGSQEGS